MNVITPPAPIETSPASSAGASASISTAAASGCASAAARRSASRVTFGSDAIRSAASERRSSGTGRRPAVGCMSPRASKRAISSAKNALPREASARRTSVGRENVTPSCSLTIRWSAATESGPSSSCRERTPRKSGRLASARRDATRRMGRSSRRRRANSSTEADGGSSHCASSTATSTGPRDVSSRSTDRSAVPTSRRPGERPASARRRATSSASA